MNRRGWTRRTGGPGHGSHGHLLQRQCGLGTDWKLLVLIPAIILTAPDAGTAMRNIRSFAQEMCMAPGTIPTGGTLGPYLSFTDISPPFPRGNAVDRNVELCTSRREILLGLTSMWPTASLAWSRT